MKKKFEIWMDENYDPFFVEESTTSVARNLLAKRAMFMHSFNAVSHEEAAALFNQYVKETKGEKDDPEDL